MISKNNVINSIDFSEISAVLLFHHPADHHHVMLYPAYSDECPIYWNVNYPFPMSNRDYVYARKLKQLTRGDKVVHVILGESLPGMIVPKSTCRRPKDMQLYERPCLSVCPWVTFEFKVRKRVL